MASSQTIAEAVENSLNAYNILSKKHLESVSYDTTVKAKIVDIKNRDLGEYKVNDGTSIYYAYSDKTDYYKGQTVWVTIPNGDYSQQKFIQGKYVESDNSEPYTYTSPLDSFVDMTQNLIEQGMVNETGLIANGSVKEITLWSIFGRGIIGYDRLAIQAGFKSWLKSLNVQSGEYGLRLDIVGNMTGTSQTDDNRKMYQIFLNTNDFYGDVYNFETFYNQVKVVDISTIDCIESMSLVFYQKDDFRDSSSARVATSTISNIWVSNPYISLGFDASRFTQDTILLTSTSSKTYAPYLSDRAKADFITSLNPAAVENYEELVEKIENGDKETIANLLGELNKKNMTVNYIHIDEDGKPVVYGPGDTLPNGSVIHWYHYKLQKDINDELAGNYWEEMAPSVEDYFVVKNFYPNTSLGSEMFKVIIENPSKEEIARGVYNDGLFGNLYTEEKASNQSYYQWVMAGLNALENGKAIAVSKLSRNEISATEQEIYDEYKAALAAKGVTANQAAADDINQEYRKRLMNVKSDAQAVISQYSEMYSQIVGIMAETVLYYSDVLVFTNEEETVNDLSLQLVKSLTLEVDDDYKGNYHIYDEQGNIISKRESQKKRVITANWERIITGDYGSSGIESIEWRIPTVNTMIQYPEKGIEYTDYEEIKFDNQIDFESYPYNLYRKKLDSDTDYVLVTDRTIDYRQTFYKRSITSYTPDSKGNDYFSIKRPSREFEEYMPGTEEPSSSGQIFRIKDFYNENFVNNTIKCIVRKNNLEYTAELTLTFGPTGTAGTDFTFELEFADKIPALTLGNSRITVIPHLYNYENKDVIEKYLNTLEYGWHSPLEPNNIVIDQSNLNLNKGKITISITNQNTIEDLRYYILGAKVKVSTLNNKEVYLYTYKPVPVRLDDGFISIDGADRVCYNSAGTNPSYYKDPYKIYTYENQATTEIQDVSWQISLGEELNGLTPDPNFYPILSDQYALIPPSVYIKENGREVAVECIQDGQIVWTQPIYIYQNEYSSALLNSWDGSLTFDEENGIILSRTVGAGSKDNRNRYKGVIMGDVAQVDNTPIYGLYGYSEGVQSFGFKIDGTAFIGKSGKGQINFDGNSGQISSLSRNVSAEKGEGMLIDLDDGFIDIKGSEITNIKRISDGTLLTVNEALSEYQSQLESAQNSYEEKIARMHIWDEMDDIQLLENQKVEYEQGINDITRFFNEMIQDATEKEKLKYLRDNELTYLINNDDYIPVYESNRTGVHISTVNPYFTITSGNAKDLIHIADDEYYLQTDDFEPESEYEVVEDEQGNIIEHNGRGLKINLKGGQDETGYIEGYNFKLKGVNSADNKFNGSFFELNSSGQPFLQVHYKNDGRDNDTMVQDLRLRGYLGENEVLEKDLINISDSGFFLQSHNYFNCEFNKSQISGYRKHEIDPTKAGDGFKLDLVNGLMEGHNFDIIAVNSKYTVTNGVIKYDANAGSYLMMSSGGDPYFRIHYQYIGDNTENPVAYSNYTKWDIITNKGVYVNKNVDLINISNSAFDIYSRDFQEPGKTGVYRDELDSRVYHTLSGTVGKGVHFDLSGNKVIGQDNKGKDIQGSILEAYSFLLDAYRPDLIFRDIRARIRINSVATGANKGEIYNLVPDQDYLLSNPNETEDHIQDLIDTRRKEHPDETFAESAASSDLKGKVKIITTVNYDNPLMIGGLFSVSWSGKVTANYLVAKQGGRIGPYIIKSTALYSNNGVLANGKEFYDSDGKAVTEPTPHGVYLGEDGFSVRNKFVIYKNPINRRAVIGTDSQGNEIYNDNKNITHAMRYPTKNFNDDGTVEYATTYDFVTSGYYGDNNEEVNTYFIDGQKYDQVFKTSAGNIYALRNLTMYLSGASVLNGKTAINGNTYIFGKLQVGEYNNLKNIGETFDQTNNYATFYANTTVFGIFRTTGKTYLGDKTAKWVNKQALLRNDARNEIDNSRLGVVIYRNTYIAGFAKIGGGLVVGDADKIDGNTSYDDVELNSDFTAYVRNAKFYGDMEVAAGFVAGSLNQEGPYNSKFRKIPWIDVGSSTISEKNGSGIQSKYIFLGRAKADGTDVVKESDQSYLLIYANTYQWGDLIAGYRGSKVELYANSTNGSSAAFIKMSQNNGIKIHTGVGNPFELKTAGGDITLDATAADNGVITLKGGNKDQIVIHPSNGVSITSSGGVSITGGTGNSISMNKDGSLSISATGTTSLSGGNSSISVSSTGVNISASSSTNGVTIDGGNDKYGVSIGGSVAISGNCDITGNVTAANLKLDNTGATMSNTSYTPTSSDNGLQFRGNGSNASLWLGKWVVESGNFQSAAGNEPSICLDPTNAAILFGANTLSNAKNYIDALGDGSAGSGIRIKGTTWITGNFYVTTGGTSSTAILFVTSSQVVCKPDLLVRDTITVQGTNSEGENLTDKVELTTGGAITATGNVTVGGNLVVNKNYGITSGGKHYGTSLYIDSKITNELTTTAAVHITPTSASFGFSEANFKVNNKPLGALAFVDDIKKKFNLNFSYENSSGTTLYITQLNSANFYQLLPTNQRTAIYKIKNTLPTLYKNLAGWPNAYEANGTPFYLDVKSGKTVYQLSGSSNTYHNLQRSNGYEYYNITSQTELYLDGGTLYIWDYYEGDQRYFGYSTNYMNIPYTAYYYNHYVTYPLRGTRIYDSIVTVPSYSEVYDLDDVLKQGSMSDIGTKTKQSDYFEKIDLFSGSDPYLASASIADIAERKKITWSINETTDEITLAPNEGSTTENISITNDNFSSTPSVSISMVDYD